MKAFARSAGCLQKQATRETVPANTASLARRESAPASVHQVLRSPGKPLDPAARAAMEPRFGHDFSRVRVHADKQAAASADSMGALAYTVGRHMVFAEGQYAPATPAGKRLLAHELAHTVQQRSTAEVASLAQLRAGAVNDPLEAEAERMSETAVHGVGNAFQGVHTPFLRQESAPVLRRQPKPEKHKPDAPVSDVPPIERMPEKKEEIIEKRGPVECQPHADSKLPCTPQPVTNADFLKLGAPQDALGHTVISKGAKFTAPELNTKQAGKGPDVVILPTKAIPVSCESHYVKAGADFTRIMPLDPNKQKALFEQCNGVYTATISVTADGAKRAMAAEMEHCNDFKYAFDISLGCYEGVINDLAKKKTKFPSEKAAVEAITQKVGRPPDQWSSYYVELLEKSKIRDRADNRWHIPVDQNMPVGEMKVYGHGHCVAKNKTLVDQKSYPAVGRHPSSQIIK